MRTPVLKDDRAFRYFTFFYLYIMQGIPAGFALTAIANYLLGRHIPPQTVGGFIALVGLPWTVQFVWGPLIDRFQYSSMGHRKHWIVLSQLVAVVASLGLLLVSDVIRQLGLLTAVFFVHSIFASIQVASVDAMAITIGPVHERGKLNGFMRGGFLLGTAFGAAALSYLLHRYGFRTAAFVQSGILFFFTGLFLFTRQERGDVIFPWNKPRRPRQQSQETNPPMKDLFRRIYVAIMSRESMRYFGLVATVYIFSSIFIRAYVFYLINTLHWPDKTVSLLQGSWGSLLTLAAIIVAGISADRAGPKKMQVKVMWGVCIFLLVVNGTFFWWRHDWYAGTALLLWNLADPLLSVSIFPVLMGLCREKVEGSQFTTYLALINLCDVVGSYLTGWAVTVVPAPLIGCTCGLLLGVVLLLLKNKNSYAVIPG